MLPSNNRWPLRAAAALALVATISLPSHALSLFGMGKKAPATPLGAVLSTVEGDVQIQKAGTSTFLAAKGQTRLSQDDEIKTGSTGKALVVFLDGSKIRLNANTSFTLQKDTPRKVNVKVAAGLLEAWIKKASGRTMYVRTPTAVAAVRGTEFRCEVDIGGATTWDLFGGSLDVSDNFGNQIPIETGQRLVAKADSGLAEAKVEVIPPTIVLAPEPVAPPPPPPGDAPPPTEEAPPPADEPPPPTEEAPPPTETMAPPPAPPPSNPLQDTTVTNTQVSPSSP